METSDINTTGLTPVTGQGRNIQGQERGQGLQICPCGQGLTSL
jgi:hypothetical protein